MKKERKLVATEYSLPSMLFHTFFSFDPEFPRLAVMKSETNFLLYPHSPSGSFTPIRVDIIHPPLKIKTKPVDVLVYPRKFRSNS